MAVRGAMPTQVKAMYRWTDVAARTVAVYDCVASSSRDDTMIGRLQRYYRCGSWFGKICCCIAALDAMYWAWLRWWQPAHCMDIAPDFPRSSVICNVSTLPKQKGKTALHDEE